MHLTATTEMKNLAKEIFGYTGRKFEVAIASTYRLEAYWSEGSRSSCVLVSRDGLAYSHPTPATKDPFKKEAHQTIDLPPGHFVLEHCISCGKDMGITFYVRPDEADTFELAPPSEELTRNEKIVLLATLSLKSSYGGIRNYRLHEAKRDTDITSLDYEAAKASLIERGYLNKAGAATIKGKNERSRLPGNLRSQAFSEVPSEKQCCDRLKFVPQ